MKKKNKNIGWCALFIILAVLIIGIILCCVKVGTEPEKEKGYLIKQMKEEEHVSRA